MSTDTDNTVEATPKSLNNLRIFLDTGLQKHFVPIAPSTTTPQGQLPESLAEAMAKAVENFNSLPPALQDVISDEKNWADLARWHDANGGCKFIRYRFGYKSWKLPNGDSCKLSGLWFMIETNTSAQNENRGDTRNDRGVFYKADPLAPKEKDEIIAAHKAHSAYPKGEQFYIGYEFGKDYPLQLDRPDGKRLDLGGLQLHVVVVKPGAEEYDVDAILDLGNTRTAGLLFAHYPNMQFVPNQFPMLFKILRLNPDPSSGEYGDADEVSAGIADSWFMLHELDSQEFCQEGSPEPKLLQQEFSIKKVEETKHFLGPTTYDVTGCLVRRIPQMFTELSPVLIGESAIRQLDFQYAHVLMGEGAPIQQSSPKRYYWDDTPGKYDWCMILNEWDKEYSLDSKAWASLPVLQGELFRYIREDGSVVDLREGVSPANMGDPYPQHPRFPRKSTLTWFLLHIIERAYAQSNMSFDQNFTPHKLAKILMTYPSGWTSAEVETYRRRCQEILDIFTVSNVYKGLASDSKIELVPDALSPDEAVAGQLPVLFSEVLRYPGQCAEDWIATMGKARIDPDGNTRNSVRIMNFDIGGGTTDISIIEYTDANADNTINANIIDTQLLFKGGHTLAGDDLVKAIIEKLILNELIKNTSDILTGKEDMSLSSSIHSVFSSAPKTKNEEAMRGFVIRTVLVPMARFCLANASAEEMGFSVAQAGIKPDNWDEFKKCVDAPANALSFDTEMFRCGKVVLDPIIESTFGILFENGAKYAAAYDADMLVFCGKPSELAYVHEMANRFMPVDREKIIFAKSFKPGTWYPFLDKDGFIKDAKTMTVVGAALFYALSSGYISGWTVRKLPSTAIGRNEWGEYVALHDHDKVFLKKDAEECDVSLLPNMILARRQNACSTAEPVYKFIDRRRTNSSSGPVSLLKCHIARKTEDNGGESLQLVSVDGQNVGDFELKLWPSSDANGVDFWQESGIFSLEGDDE